MGKSSNRSTEYFFTGRYEDDNDGNTIHAIGVGGVINAYGGNDYIVVGSIGATVNTTWGHDTVVGGAGYLNINDTSGSLTVKGGSGYTAINKTHNGTIEFAGVAGGLNINHTGDNGAVNYSGVSGYNGITRKGVQGDIRFQGAGGYNSLYSDVEQGNIHFAGAGGYNRIIRKGADSDLSGEGIEYADAKEIILKSATMHGSWIDNDSQVSGIKSAREPNTYLFAFADSTYTKIHKIRLLNDPVTGKLTYHSTAWYKEGNHLKGLEKQDITEQNGFVDVGIDGAYTLSNLIVEHKQAATIQAVQQKLTENEWMTYGSGLRIKADDVILSDARMGGYAVYRDGTTVDVKAVKSHRTPNTYVYAKKLGIHTKIVVVELKNDPETGILQYIARPWYKEGDHTTGLADKIISERYGYHPMGTGAYSLSELHYSARVIQTTTDRVAGTYEYSDQPLFPVTERRETSGDVRFEGAGGGNVVKSNVTKGNVYFSGAGIANVIEHTSEFGNTEFNGAGGANVIIKKGKEGNLTFNGAGVANVLLHQGKRGDMEVNAGGAANVLVRVGDGRYLAHLLAVGNISIHKGNGDSRISMGGGFNTHTQMGHGDAVWSGVGGANVLTSIGQGKVSAVLAGGANILTKMGKGDLAAGLLGGANIITHISDSSDDTASDKTIRDKTIHYKTTAIALGGANVLTKKGKGDLLSVMGGGANVLTHIGNGATSGVLLGGANILTKVGDGDTTGIMLGLGNVLTHVGDGQTLGVMAAAGNIFTKVGDGETLAAMLAFGNLFTHVGDGNTYALMAGGGNIFTKVGDGNALALMLAFGNVFTHVGDGLSVALMIAKGNIATKAGNGDALAAMVGKGNIFTQIGHGSTFAAMIGGANILTKVGNDLTAALMIGKANIYTHVGEGTSIGLLSGTANIMTKVGDGTTLAAMFGKANIMTHVGNGMTGVLAQGKANIVTKVGNGFMGVVAASEANVVTHIGEGTTAALLNSKGNILTKVGDGTAVGLLISKIGNIMTHIGDGATVGFAKGEANIITKVGDGTGVNAVWGKANILTHYGDGDRYNFAKGEANIITKVGDGQETTVVQGQANIITHIGNGDDYTGTWGKANVITKVGNGRNVVLAKGDANIVTQVGEGDSFNALWSQGNVVTKVGDGIQATVAKGKGNITTTVGNGLSVTAVHGDLNVNTKVGDGVSVNVAWGKYNVNTRVGDGLNISVMKGTGNANIRVGDGLNINASYARNNVAVQVGNGDFYSLAVAASNTESNKLGALFDNVKQTLLGSAGSQAISYLVNGDEAHTSGTHKGRGAIDLPEVSSLDGFRLTEVDEVTSELQDNLQSAVSAVDTPDIDAIQRSLSHEESQHHDIAEHVSQDQAARNALQDKEKAEADRHRLEQEKEKQLAAISGTQSQLEKTDLTALNANGESQREAINDEARSVTQELMTKTKGLEALADLNAHHGQSGQQWRDQFADGLLGNIQTHLDSAKETAQQQLEHVQQASSQRLGEVKDAVAKSESGATEGDQHRQHAMQKIDDAHTDIEFREQKAIAHMRQAEQAARDGKSAAQKAEQRGQRAVSAAEIKTAQVQSDANSAKLDGNQLPDREKTAGSGLSGQAPAYTEFPAEHHAGENDTGETRSPADFGTDVQTEDEFGLELQYLEEDLGELVNAKSALDRLQINAGIRTRKQHINLDHHNTEATHNPGIAQTPAAPDLSGLTALGASQPEQTDTPEHSDAALRAQKVANIYQWLDSDNNLTTETYIPVPGFERVDADIPDTLRQKMVTFVEGYLNGTENSIPKAQRTSLAKLFVDATVDYNWDKRVEFVSKLEHYGYSFAPVHGDKSIVSFWSGRNFKQYRNILDAAQTDGRKVVYDIDVKGNAFAIELNKMLTRWGDMFLDPDIAEQNALKSVINASARSNTGFWSSLYATGSRDDVYVIAEGGLRLGNYFWNVELPVLRQLQREGLVGEIRLLDKAAKEYQGVSPENIGRRLTDAGVSVKARFDSLSFEEQERRLALNPTDYKPDTLIDLDIKTSAIDTLLNQALPFYGLRTERNLLVRESDDYNGFEIRPWPGRSNDGSEIIGFKNIIVEDTENTEQTKAIERFILANYDNYQQLPDTLYLVEDRIVSHDNGRTRILAEKTDGSWRYKPKTELMSADELQQAAYVKGKIRGESYQRVLDALTDYQNGLENSRDYDLEAIEKLSGLRHQVEGYLLGHPDSARVPALKNLLSQIQVRLDETLAIAESAVESSAKGSFSDLYAKLGNASLKESKHLYIDEQGNLVTRGKSNIQINVKAERAEKALEQIRASVAKEYGQSVAEAVFSDLTSRDLAKDGKGIDVAGLKKVHKAIEQQLSPVSATLFIWKPSDHSRLGHAALQIGHGRIEISAENAAEFNEKNYVSWWPKGGKSTNVWRIFDVSTEEHPDVKLRWRDLSQPAGQNDALALDVASEEKDNFGLHDGARKLERFIEKLQTAKGVDARFEEISEGFAMAALANPNLLKSVGVPEHISRPFMQQWEDSSMDMLEVGKNFAEALRTAAKQQTPERIEKRIAQVISQFAESELRNIKDFKASEPDQGRVFRINLAGLDVAAMQAEWHKISQNPDARYQLLTGNCSSTVARVLKAGGADQIIGHKRQPHFGIWTPTELFNYAQALQEAQAESTARKANRRKHAEGEVKIPLGENVQLDSTPANNTEADAEHRVQNQPVGEWETVTVKPQAEGGESRFSGQVIIQTENDPVAARAAADLAGKHPDSSVIVQLDTNGQYRVVYGEPAQLSGKLRWQIVGHGRDEAVSNLTRMGGYSADELAQKLKQFRADFTQAGTPEHISLVGCSLIRDDKRDGFARRFISALDSQGLRTTVSARSSDVAVDSSGRKYTRDAQEQWIHKLVDSKVVLGWNEKGEVESYSERIRHGISENSISLSRVGRTGAETETKGAIAENTATFHAPVQDEKQPEKQKNNLTDEMASDRKLSYSGNIQVQVGDGEFTAVNWGTTNVGIKVGTGGFKSLAFGDNNVMVHIGNGDSRHSVDIAGYQAFEGAQLFVGNRNVSFNLGRSNDLIVMLEKSIPTPPLINPFDGAARISAVLQNISAKTTTSQTVSSQTAPGLSGSADWLTAQEQQWTLEGAKKYVSDLSGIDLTSSVRYETLTELNTENDRSSRGLKSDLESSLNKKYNQWLGGKGNKPESGSLSRADKFRQANEKLAFNFAIGGQGADIQVTTGNWNFMFGDNIQSILDTNLGSLFGLMTQEYTATGMAKTTFTFSPTDLPRQIKNKLLGNLAGVSAETTLADIFAVDYTSDGRIVSRNGISEANQPADGIAILREMLEIIGEFSGDQLQSFTDPEKLLNGLKAGLNTGTDGIQSFAESHGLKAKTPDEIPEDNSPLNENAKQAENIEGEQPERAFGFNALNLPNLFATLFSQGKQAEMQSLVTNLKENLTTDLLNMQDKTFDFLRNSGHLQGDGDIHVSLGNYNFNWGGDGKDLGAYLGDNNNFWGGRGDDVFYSVGTSNIFAGGEGNDIGVLMGRENMMFGGAGDDIAVLAGRINYAYMGDGDDQVFAFGEGGMIEGGKGSDYIVASGNFNRVSAGEDQDYVVTIGNNNQVDLGSGDDFATVFGNYNRIDGNTGRNAIKLMGYHAVINGGTGNDHLIADVVSKFSRFNGGEGNDLLVLGGYQNRFKGGSGVNSFVVSGDVIENVVEDIKATDKIIFNNLNWQNLWFRRSGYDLVLLTNRSIQDKSLQGQFEAVGSVTFTNYFNGNRADIITQMEDKSTQDEHGYTALSANAVDTLVQAMSGFSPEIGNNGFIDLPDSRTTSAIITAWADTMTGKFKSA
ncbi:MARTX multifunctional-autoprocessing repeats-in-toxin holotoxin RtxA [Xenorhabdus innexi]|uniref:RTX toxin RtxA n=1 Tax=Xenorhabdus innexi TaxID=290109 RepID=A0A2G0NSP5_9GAMM|nr:MARTX multifunctional-autoprocessing repeats-in-toxin holotoxin RtxA [Xenorhabdus innexi]PHM37719.1 RTX toxin RtxA [Xenorhabdus innexi]